MTEQAADWRSSLGIGAVSEKTGSTAAMAADNTAVNLIIS